MIAVSGITMSYNTVDDFNIKCVIFEYNNNMIMDIYYDGLSKWFDISGNIDTDLKGRIKIMELPDMV